MTDLAPKPKPSKRSQTKPKGWQDGASRPPVVKAKPKPDPVEVKTEIPPAPTPQVEAKPKPTITAVPALDMQELWDIACTYGKVRVYHWSDGKLGCRIDMINSDGILLEAQSDFDHANPCDALKTAIARARKVKGISIEGGA